MRVLVMGAGAVGGYLGARLLRAGHPVTFVARGPHLDALRAAGLRVRTTEGEWHLSPVRAVAVPVEADGPVELVLFTVKGDDTAAAAAALVPAVGPATTVLTLQNGVESGEALGAVLGRDRVLLGAVTVEVERVAPGVVEQRGTPPRLVVGELEGGPTPRAEAVAAAFREAGVAVTVTADGRRAVWEKFVRLAPGATLTTAAGVPIGALRDSPEGAWLYRTLIAETVAVGRAAGVALGEDAVERALAFVRGLPAAMTTSMARDDARGRPLELEPITGAVRRLGRCLGVATPAYDVLYAVLKVRVRARRGDLP